MTTEPKFYPALDNLGSQSQVDSPELAVGALRLLEYYRDCQEARPVPIQHTDGGLALLVAPWEVCVIVVVWLVSPQAFWERCVAGPSLNWPYLLLWLPVAPQSADIGNGHHVPSVTLGFLNKRDKWQPC